MSKKEKETALATKENAAIATAPPPGLEVFDSRDQVIPRRKIVQPVSREGTPGSFRDSLTGDELAGFRMVLLSMRKGRVLWPRDEKGQPVLDAPIVCRSDDAAYPSVEVEDAPADICGETRNGRWVDLCPKATWGPKGAKPECSLQYQLMCLDVDDADNPQPFLFSAGGAQLKPIKGVLAYAFQHQVALYSFSFMAGLKRVAGAKGTYYVIEFSDRKEIGDKYAGLFARLAGYDVQKTYEAEGAEADVPF